MNGVVPPAFEWRATPSRWASVNPVLLSLVRFMIGLMLLEYGLMKLFSFPGSINHGQPLPVIIYLSGVIEFFAGGLLTVGLFTRTTSFVVSGEMAFVYFLFFLHRSPWPAQNGGDLQITWCFVLLYISAARRGTMEFRCARWNAASK